MIVEQFQIDKHYNELCDALTLWGHPHPTRESIPEYGYLVCGIAYAFIRRVEGGYAQLDGLTSNPSVSKKIRSEALDLVVKSCIEQAKVLGITQVLGFCSTKSPIMRSLKHGFAVLPHAVIALEIK